MDSEELPAAYASWRRSRLGRITDRREQELILRLIGPIAGRRILDAGCGDGALVGELGRRGARATGIDVSTRMVSAARRRADGAGADVTFGMATVDALPFAAASFDVVTAITVLCFVDDAAGAVCEMARVLKPGGRLVIGELGRWNSWAINRRIRGWLGSPIWRQARFRSAGDLRRFAGEAGLGNVTITGAIFYPPVGLAARLLEPVDPWIGERTTCGAAFLALGATKPAAPCGALSSSESDAPAARGPEPPRPDPFA